MAIRWRKDGTLICAAMSAPEEGDTYIDDGMHYRLSVEEERIVADKDHKLNGLWHWATDGVSKYIAVWTEVEDNGWHLERYAIVEVPEGADSTVIRAAFKADGMFDSDLKDAELYKIQRRYFL